MSTTDPEAVSGLNPYRNIVYVNGSHDDKFAVTVIENGKRRTLGHFATLIEAQRARDRYIDYHANKHMRSLETATYIDPNLETRAY